MNLSPFLTRIPTGAYAIGLVATVLFTMASDRLRSRTGIAFVISLINLVAGILLASATSQGVIMAGYMINASTYSYGPVMIVCPTATPLPPSNLSFPFSSPSSQTFLTDKKPTKTPALPQRDSLRAD